MAGITPPASGGGGGGGAAEDRAYAFKAGFIVPAAGYATPTLELGDNGDNFGDLFEIGGASGELIVVNAPAIVAVFANIVFGAGVGGEQVGASLMHSGFYAWVQQSAITDTSFETFIGVSVVWRLAAGDGFKVTAWSADTQKNGVYTDVFAQAIARL